MEPEEYCDIFCSHLLRPRLHRVVGDWNALVTLDNGDGLGFGRIERYHDIFMGTDSIIFHFDYLPFESQTDTFIVVGFRLIVTIHHVDDSEIEEDCL